MIIGGFHKDKNTDKTFIVNLDSGITTEGPSLITKRYSHSATTFVMDGTEYIAVAGGFDEYHVICSVEIIKTYGSDGSLSVSQWESLGNMNIPR